MGTPIIGREIVSEIFRTRNLQPYLDRGWDIAWMTDNTNPEYAAVFTGQDTEAYKLILKHHEKFGKVPELSHFQKSFPEVSYRLSRNSYTAPELLEMAVESVNSYIIEVATVEAQRHLEAGESYLAGQVMAEAARKAQVNHEGGKGGREARIEAEMENLRIRKEAKLRFAMEESEDTLVFGSNTMDEPEQDFYRIEDLLIEDGHLMIMGRRKAGKSTLVGNLVRSLVTREKFLGEYRVEGFNRVFLLDLEMSPNRHKHWLMDFGVFNDPRLFVGHYRGRAGAVVRTLFDPWRRKEFVSHLQENRITVLVVDPLGPLLRAAGIDENSADVGRVVDALKEIAQEAGIAELIVVHHQGKDSSRGGRGHSVLEDSPDVLWYLEGPDDGPANKLVARGRDVDAKVFLSYDADTRSLTGGRDTDESDEAKILNAIEDNPGSSGNELFMTVKGIHKTKFGEIIKELHESGRIVNTGSESRPKWSAA